MIVLASLLRRSLCLQERKAQRIYPLLSIVSYYYRHPFCNISFDSLTILPKLLVFLNIFRSKPLYYGRRSLEAGNPHLYA